MGKVQLLLTLSHGSITSFKSICIQTNNNPINFLPPPQTQLYDLQRRNINGLSTPHLKIFVLLGFLMSLQTSEHTTGFE